MGLYSSDVSEWEIKLIDFSEAVYVGEGGREYDSRFESSTLESVKKFKRDPYRRFYVHKMYRCRSDQRMFQHPLFHYYVHNHFDMPLRRMFFDIRHTDLYSLITIIFVLLSPSVQTEDVIKKKLL